MPQSLGGWEITVALRDLWLAARQQRLLRRLLGHCLSIAILGIAQAVQAGLNAR
jgi:hypothetical protein